ncbi:glycosyltransferase family 4 protein [Candidatus Acetothermia bacterium]|nr:glycosyltransferase family 4 protein [Candidatus Acetothermia bacterium]MBI3643978.1 glycosyltransferase family 4 protein [Candidatus Acetothermia bacterium]
MGASLVEAPTQISMSFKNKRFAFFSHLDFNLYRFRLALMQELITQGAQVLAISPSGEYSSLFKQHRIEFVPFDFDRLSFNPIAVLGVMDRLTQLLHKLRPNLLHTFTLRPNAYGGIAGQHARVPVIVSTVTGLGSLYSDNFGFRGAVARVGVNNLTRRALSRASAVIFQNPDDQKFYLDKRLCRSEQTRLIIGSGVDVNLFSPQAVSEERKAQLRKEWRLAPDEIVVTMVARLLASKGVYEFLQAGVRMRNRARFVLIGDPDPGNPSTLTVESLRPYISQGNLIAPGYQENIPEWLAISDIYALPSYGEGLPRTVLEAMAMELPVITTDVPGCRETVNDGENGYLIPPRNSEALAQALERLTGNPKLRQTMGKRSREIVESRFSNCVILEQYLNLYKNLLAENEDSDHLWDPARSD